MPPPTAMSGAGEWGHLRSMPASSSNVAAATARVSREVAGISWMRLRMSLKNPCLVMCIPSSFGTWSRMMTSPIPALKPVRTGVEMKLATNPRRSAEARSRSTPVSADRVATAVISLPGSPSGTARPNCVPVRIASVAVELTLSTRDVPSSA